MMIAVVISVLHEAARVSQKSVMAIIIQDLVCGKKNLTVKKLY